MTGDGNVAHICLSERVSAKGWDMTERPDGERRRRVDMTRERRRLAARRLAKLEIDVPPDPADLSRVLEAAHQPGGLP